MKEDIGQLVRMCKGIVKGMRVKVNLHTRSCIGRGLALRSSADSSSDSGGSAKGTKASAVRCRFAGRSAGSSGGSSFGASCCWW